MIAAPLTLELGLDAGDLGLLTSVDFLTFAAAQIAIGILLDGYGPWQIQSILLVVAAVDAAFFAASDNLLVLFVGRALVGLGVAASLTAGLKALAEAVITDLHRAAAMASGLHPGGRFRSQPRFRGTIGRDHFRDVAVEFRNDLRARAVRFGRDPNTLKVLPGIVPVIGDTEKQAKALQLPRGLRTAAALRLEPGRTGTALRRGKNHQRVCWHARDRVVPAGACDAFMLQVPYLPGGLEGLVHGQHRACSGPSATVRP